MNPPRKRPHRTSWEGVGEWYASCVGKEGHYYHQSLILPGVLKLLSFPQDEEKTLLDIGCGQGVLARALPSRIAYVGIDASPSLIKEARALKPGPNQTFLVADATKPLPLEGKRFDYATFILSLQNMEDAEKALRQARNHLNKGAHLLIVLNHPCFRIPRQSSWGIDEASKLQYRRINSYASSLKIPIQMAPSQGKASQETFSFHHSLADYFSYLAKASFATLALEEWCSDKKSEGSKARMEDRARKEIPLFLALLARAE